MSLALKIAENGLVPSTFIRTGIRRLLRQRLQEQEAIFGTPGAVPESDSHKTGMESWVQKMRSGSVALVPEKANEQHYEVPPEFFQIVLGKNLKYSSALYESTDTTLDEAEEAMLDTTVRRAELKDGHRILELGCGWGSLTLHMARRFPGSNILAVSNSAPQRAFIEERLRSEGLKNVEIVTADMNDFDALEHVPAYSIDRVVSVEMFEHIRNWEALFSRIHRWLHPEGLLFQHVFAHQRYAYAFEVVDESDWMSRYFFSGGMMPSHDLLDYLKIPFEIKQRWQVDGQHYSRTSEDWLRNMDNNRRQVMAVLRGTYGDAQAEIWFNRWRIFFLSCAELFGYQDGNEWFVSHNLLQPRSVWN